MSCARLSIIVAAPPACGVVGVTGPAWGVPIANSVLSAAARLLDNPKITAPGGMAGPPPHGRG